jgi:glycosyltransferase involved in cell wall biosynthesis
LFSDKPFQVHYFFQSHANKKINRSIKEFSPDHIYCQLIRTTEYVKNILDIPKTLDFMDAFNAGHRRRIQRSSWFMRILLREEAKRLVAYENLIFDYFDHHVIISAPDRKLLFHPLRDKVVVIPNGVDSSFFTPDSSIVPVHDLVFTGNMSYPPNVDCAIYIVHEVLPLVIQKKPGTRLLIAGANPTLAVKKLEGDNVVVSGWMEDIRDAYRESKIFIAPMQMGTGLQNKLLEAMSMNLPCITTSLAADALGGINGEHYLLGDNATQVAHHILDLLDNPEKAKSLAQRGHSFVLSHFDWEKTVDQLDKLLSGKTG